MARRKRESSDRTKFIAPTQGTLDLAIELLTTADADLSAAQVLYSACRYPHAVFCLQQAIEKSAKAYALAIGAANWAELSRTFSHDTLYLFRRMAEFRAAQAKTDPSVKIVGGMSAVNELAAYCDHPQLLPRQVLQKFLTWLGQVFRDHQSRDSKDEDFATEEIAGSWLCGSRDPALRQKAWKAAAQVSRHISFAAYAIPAFMVLGVATLPHAIAARYPDQNTSPRKIYTPRHTLVACFNEVAQNAAQLFKELRGWLVQRRKEVKA